MILDYKNLLARYPWIIEEGQDCILSPDSDGLLCGLFMSHHLNWKIRGFYDGKVLIFDEGIDPRKCVFLDMEILRSGVRSVGQHMLMYDKKDLPKKWNDFSQCISANNLRDFDFKNDFKEKYPLGTIHLLAAIVGQNKKVIIKKNAVSSLLYTDGTFKNQFNYPENCLKWLDYLCADKNDNPLRSIFMDPHYSTYELMIALRDIFADINRIGGGKRGGDKIRISDSRGNPVSLRGKMFKEEITKQAESFIEMLADRTGWGFSRGSWKWGPYRIFRFKKGSIKPGKGRYQKMFSGNLLSFAIISRNSIEYTLDPQKLF